MRHPSLNRSRISRSVAAIALLALLVAGTFYVLPHVWTHSGNNAPVANSLRASAPPPAIHQDASTQATARDTVKSASPILREPTPQKIHAATLNAALQQIPASATSNDLSRLEA